MSGAEARLDGSRLVVQIPMRFRRRGGRKRIVAPDGSEIVPTPEPQPDGTLRSATRAKHDDPAKRQAASRLTRHRDCKDLGRGRSIATATVGHVQP